jgi:hypothetical protein
MRQIWQTTDLNLNGSLVSEEHWAAQNTTTDPGKTEYLSSPGQMQEIEAMFRTATVMCIGLCLVASQALAETDAQSGATVTVASDSGLYVRVASPSTDRELRTGNVYGSAVNTGGITRATTAVKIGGRVFLTGGHTANVGEVHLAAAAAHQTDAGPARKSPQGLGAWLASIFGLWSS